MILETIDIEAIVEGQFLAFVDVPQGVDENAPALDPGLAVGGTGVVDQPSGVPWHVAIQIVVLGKREDVNRRIAALE